MTVWEIKHVVIFLPGVKLSPTRGNRFFRELFFFGFGGLENA